jgi:hypothetical protein
LLVYRKANDFLKLILYPAFLLKVSMGFFMDFPGPLGIRSCHLQIGIV